MPAGTGATAIHAAAGAGHTAIVEALLDAHADIDVQASLLHLEKPFPGDVRMFELCTPAWEAYCICVASPKGIHSSNSHEEAAMKPRSIIYDVTLVIWCAWSPLVGSCCLEQMPVW